MKIDKPDSVVDFPDDAMQRLFDAAVQRMEEYAKDHPDDEAAQLAWKDIQARNEMGIKVLFDVVGQAFFEFVQPKIVKTTDTSRLAALN